jgi:hypothetical protein
MQTLLRPIYAGDRDSPPKSGPRANVRGTAGGDALSRGQSKSITDLTEQEGVTDAALVWNAQNETCGFSNTNLLREVCDCGDPVPLLSSDGNQGLARSFACIQ